MSRNYRPQVITLCGSTRFKEEFDRLDKELTLKGFIVLKPGVWAHSGDGIQSALTKRMLDELHKRKIDISDQIIVINKGGYIGESTRSEIDYALNVRKIPVGYIESIND